MEEIWRSIDGYEGLYEISNMGRVKTYRSNKVLKNSVRPRGYLFVTLYNGGTHKSHSIHRLVAQAFISNPNNYPIINHKDGNPSNNIVSNLEWCTYSYNEIHKYTVLGYTNHFKGKRHRKESIDKMKSWQHAHKRVRGDSPLAKRVKSIENNKCYDSLTSAAIELKAPTGNISRAIKYNRTCAGFHWIYL